MKKVLICGLMAAAFGFGGAVQAQTASFNVTASVTPTCIADNASTPEVAFGAVTAFQAGTAQGTIKFTCTRGVNVTGANLDATTGTVAGFNYSLTVDGGASSAGAGTGNGDSWTFTVDGTIASGQAGEIGAPVTDARTLTIAF